MSTKPGAEVLHRRLAAGLPPADVARRVGIPPSFLAAIESGDRLPPESLVEEIREAILALSGGYWDPYTDEYLSPSEPH